MSSAGGGLVAAGCRPQIVERRVGRNPPYPGAEAAGRIEVRAAPVGPPEGIREHVVGRRMIADDPQDPAVNVALELPEQLLEGRFVAPDESAERRAACSGWPAMWSTFLTPAVIERFA